MILYFLKQPKPHRVTQKHWCSFHIEISQYIHSENTDKNTIISKSDGISWSAPSMDGDADKPPYTAFFPCSCQLALALWTLILHAFFPNMVPTYKNEDNRKRSNKWRHYSTPNKVANTCPLMSQTLFGGSEKRHFNIWKCQCDYFIVESSFVLLGHCRLVFPNSAVKSYSLIPPLSSVQTISN